MRVLFLGDIVGNPGRYAIEQNLKNQIVKNDIAFVIANGENAAFEGVGITKSISEKLFNSGVDVITTGNHVWDQKETADYINTENRLLRPLNLIKPSPGNGFEVYNSKNGLDIKERGKDKKQAENDFLKSWDIYYEKFNPNSTKNNINKFIIEKTTDIDNILKKII